MTSSHRSSGLITPTRRQLIKTATMGAAALSAPALFGRSASAAGREIKVGFVSPKTGPIAAFASSDDFVLSGMNSLLKDGIEIAGKTHPVKIIVKDSQSNPSRAAEVASELILKDKVDLVLASSTADTTNPVADQCELNEIPCITTDTPWDAHFFGRGGNPAVGFNWTYHFFWGLGQIADSFTALWDTIPTNKKVGVLWSNDSDGVPISNAEHGLPPLLKKNGYEVIDAGFFEPLADNFTAQISKLKAADVDIVSGVFIPPTFTTFWTQCAQQGFKPKAVTVAKALLFPSSLEALGDRGVGLSSELWWSPAHPFKSSLSGQSAKEFADAYMKESGRQWVQPMGFKHALLEVAVNVLKRTANVDDRASIRDAIVGTDMATIVGPVSWKKGPVKNAAQTPLVGGQWIKGEKYPYEIAVAENKTAPEIPVTQAFKPLS